MPADVEIPDLSLAGDPTWEAVREVQRVALAAIRKRDDEIKRLTAERDAARVTAASLGLELAELRVHIEAERDDFLKSRGEFASSARAGDALRERAFAARYAFARELLCWLDEYPHERGEGEVGAGE